jgi:hypothetical protein
LRTWAKPKGFLTYKSLALTSFGQNGFVSVFVVTPSFVQNVILFGIECVVPNRMHVFPFVRCFSDVYHFVLQIVGGKMGSILPFFVFPDIMLNVLPFGIECVKASLRHVILLILAHRAARYMFPLMGSGCAFRSNLPAFLQRAHLNAPLR